MKRIVVSLVFCLALCLLVLPALAAGKTHDVAAEIVSVDAKANTITIKDAEGGTKSVPVLEGARPSLRTLKAGDRCTLTCQDDEAGAHQGVSAIRVQPAEHKG